MGTFSTPFQNHWDGMTTTMLSQGKFYKYKRCKELSKFLQYMAKEKYLSDCNGFSKDSLYFRACFRVYKVENGNRKTIGVYNIEEEKFMNYIS